MAFLSISLADGQWSKRTQVHPRPLQRRRPPPTAPNATVAGASAALAPPTGGSQAPADCLTGGAPDAGKLESSGGTVTGETIVEVRHLVRNF